MNRLAHLVSRMLEPEEREAVLGDFEESGVAGVAALRDLLSLVARRQAALWKDWRPWLALVSLVIPIGLLLSREVRHLASGTAIYSWMYFNNWTPTYLENAGFRADLLRDAGTFLLDYLAVIFWAWTVGFAVGSLSRGAAWINGAALCALLFGQLAVVPPLHYGVNAAAFAVEFYRSVLPVIFQIALIMIPAVFGIYKGTKLIALSPRQMMLWTAVCVGLVAWWGESLHWGMGMLLPFALAWPAACLVAKTNWKHWHKA